jgi:hypothetical protein
MQTALHRLITASQDLVRARAALDRAQAAYQAIFRQPVDSRGSGIVMYGPDRKAEWQRADAAHSAAWHEFARVVNEATVEQLAASVPHPIAPRLPLAVEMAQYCRQSELRRQFEQECA